MTQPTALRLADLWEKHSHGYARTPEARTAAELRRLHQFSEEQIGRATAAEAALQMTKATHALKIAALERQRDALLEALKALEVLFSPCVRDSTQADWIDRARAAIKAVEEA